MLLFVLAAVIAISDAQIVGVFTPLNNSNYPNYPHNNNNHGVWPALPNNNNNGAWPPLPNNNNNRPIGWVNPQPSYQNNQNHYPRGNFSNGTQVNSRDTIYGSCVPNNEVLFKTLITKPSSIWRAFSSSVKEIEFPDRNSKIQIDRITCIKITNNANVRGASSSILRGGPNNKYVVVKLKSPGEMDFAMEVYGFSKRQ